MLDSFHKDPLKWILWGIIILVPLWGFFVVDNGIQYMLNGIRFGSILMLGAIGLTLTFKILNFANFSHGDIIIFGAYVAFAADWWLVGQLPAWVPALANPANGEWLRWSALILATVAGVLGAILLALIIDRVLYRRMRRSATVVLVIASFGMALFIRALVQAIWGVGNRAYAMRIRPPMRFELFGTELKITTVQLVTIIVAFSLVTLVHLFLKYTKTGKAMRAMSDNMDLAQVTGINVERTIRWTWGIGAGLAAVSGVFIGLNFGAFNPNSGIFILLALFSAVILGGIGSPYGAMLGGFIIGIAQTLFVAPVKLIEIGDFTLMIGSQYKPGIAFFLMIIMLLIRPQGLLGKPERRG